MRIFLARKNPLRYVDLISKQAWRRPHVVDHTNVRCHMKKCHLKAISDTFSNHNPPCRNSHVPEKKTIFAHIMSRHYCIPRQFTIRTCQLIMSYYRTTSSFSNTKKYLTKLALNKASQFYIIIINILGEKSQLKRDRSCWASRQCGLITSTCTNCKSAFNMQTPW